MKKIDLSKILLKVEKPARYLGNELNSVHKDTSREDLVRFGFSFPDIYEVGMSYLGLQILYNLLNERDDIFCERIFSPAIDMEEIMREKNIPMFALESREPITNFDFLAFTLQYELSYTNILNILDLGNVPLLREERKLDDPFVLVGGPCAYNVEPISDFVDIVSLGEGEEVLLEVIDRYKSWKGSGQSREDFLYDLAKNVDGIYIPSLYEFEYKEDNTIKCVKPLKDDIPAKIQKRVMKDMDKSYFPEKIIVPFIDVVHNRVMLEIFRGCTRGCRFCQAGMIYRPIRERSPEFLKEKVQKLLENTGYEEISLSSLSTSDYSGLDEITNFILENYEDEKISLSLPSLRLDNFSLDLANRVQKVRKTGLTFAPEAGSQRLRDVINKGIEEAHLENACRKAFENGWTRLKYYFMIGLPTETYEDLDGIVDLAKKTVEIFREANGGKMKSQFGITVSTSSFVPKAFTPFQWHPQDSMEDLREKQRYLVSKFKGNRNVKYSYHDRYTSFLEAVIARGDRRIGRVILSAFKKGCKFDGWDDQFKFVEWVEAFEENKVDMEFYANRERSYDEVFPWDHFDVGVSKEFLIRENEKSKQEQLTPDCRSKCSGCGVNTDIGRGLC